MARIFIGFDPREAVVCNVLAHNINVRAPTPVSIAPLVLWQLRDIFTREQNPLQSTDLSFSRFLAPHLSDFSG